MGNQIRIERLQGAHSAELGWHDGTRTEVTLELSATETKWVESWRDPDNNTDIGLDCRDRVRLVSDATLRSSDGRLQEKLERVAFDEMSPELLSARFGRKPGALQGAYVRQGSGGGFSAVSFEIELGDGSFRGSVYEETKSGGAVSESPAVGRWDRGPSTTMSR